MAEGKTADLPPERVAVLDGGARIFEEVQRLLAIPLRVSPGGLREGALLGLL